MGLVVPCSSSSEGKAKEVKRGFSIVTFAVAVLAIDYLCLFFVEFQLAVFKSLYQGRFEFFCLLLCPTMTYCIICISFKWDGRIVLLHPQIKDVRQKQVCQYRTDYRALWHSLVSFDGLSILCLVWDFEPSFNVE